MKRNLLLGLLTLVMVCSSMAADEVLSTNSSQPQGDRVWLTSVSGAPGDVVVVDLMIQNAVTEVDAITINLNTDTDKASVCRLGRWNTESGLGHVQCQ